MEWGHWMTTWGLPPTNHHLKVCLLWTDSQEFGLRAHILIKCTLNYSVARLRKQTYPALFCAPVTETSTEGNASEEILRTKRNGLR